MEANLLRKFKLKKKKEIIAYLDSLFGIIMNLLVLVNNDIHTDKL